MYLLSEFATYYLNLSLTAAFFLCLFIGFSLLIHLSKLRYFWGYVFIIFVTSFILLVPFDFVPISGEYLHWHD